MKKKRFAVLGIGTFGKALAFELSKLGCEVLAVDRNPRIIEEIRDHVDAAAVADVREKQALKEIFTSSFDVAVVAMGEALEAAILATLHLKDLPVKEVWAEGSSVEREEVLRLVGAARVFSPEADMGRRVARRLAHPDLVESMPLSEGYSVVEVEVPAWARDKTLADLALRRKRRLAVMAVKSGEDVEVVPGGDTTLRTGDRIVVVGRDKDIEALADGP